MPSSPTATFGRGITYARPYVAFAFQAFKRRVDSTDCDFTPGARFNLASDRGAVGVAAEPQQCEENELLEFAERRSHETHIVHNVDDISSLPLQRRCCESAETGLVLQSDTLRQRRDSTSRLTPTNKIS